MLQALENVVNLLFFFAAILQALENVVNHIYSAFGYILEKKILLRIVGISSTLNKKPLHFYYSNAAPTMLHALNAFFVCCCLNCGSIKLLR